MGDKRKRVVVSKPSKTGCRTCRLRRVKCDQTRPQCVKCRSAGRNCEGYVLRVATGATREILPLRETHHSASVPRPPATVINISTSEYDRYAFDHFQKVSAAILWQSFPSRNWVIQALQLALLDDAVFFAATAVSSAIMTGQKFYNIYHHTLTRGGPPRSYISPESNTATLRQMSKATVALQRQIDSAMIHGGDVEPVLLSCLLFVVYEIMQDNGVLAKKHLRLGRNIIDESSSFERAIDSSTVPPKIKISSRGTKIALVEAFDAFDDSFQPCESPLHVQVSNAHGFESLPFEIPTSFATMEHGKEVLDLLVTCGQRFKNELWCIAEDKAASMIDESVYQLTGHCLATCMSRKIDFPVDSRMSEYLDELILAHESWTKVIARFEKTGDLKDFQALAVMHSRHFFSDFVLKTCRETSECLSDRFTNEFVRISDLAENFIHSTYENKSKHVKERETSPRGIELQNSFSLESGILPAIFLIAIKCRVPSIRRRAIGLLQIARRREGIWHSDSLAQFAECIAEFEERRAQEMYGASCDFLPEAARFSDVVLSGETHRNTKIVLARYLHEEGGEIELLECSDRLDKKFRLDVMRRRVFSVP